MTDLPSTIDELANRRQYFRVMDTASIEIEAIEAHEHGAEYFEISPGFKLLSEFQHIDVESKQLLRAITDKDKNLGQYLKLMNRKLDALSRVIALSHQDVDQSSIQEINLSEGGLSLSYKTPLEVDQELAIRLILFPSYCGLLLRGRVMCYDTDAKTQNLHIEFINIDDASQQLIARHIMRKQTQDK